MVASFRFARTIGVIPELCQLVIEFLHRGFLLLQQIGDEGLLAVLDRFFVREEFLDVGALDVFRQRSILRQIPTSAHLGSSYIPRLLTTVGGFIIFTATVAGRGDRRHQSGRRENAITPLFVSVTDAMVLTDHDGCVPDGKGAS